VELYLPTDYLEVNAQVEYRIDIVLIENPERDEFLTDTVNIRTRGYTASETVIGNDRLINGRLSYRAVVKTERERRVQEVRYYYETVDFNFQNRQRSKTGYGLPLAFGLRYGNDLGNRADINMSLQAPESLIDSFINEEFGNRIPMDRTGNAAEILFEMPEIMVERVTGNLFTQRQVASGHSNLRNPVVEGGRKFYIPIWMELGEYELNYISNRFGVNLVSIELTQELEVFAFMYATIGSATVGMDELLLIPVFPDSVLSKNLNETVINWLKN
jgi:hypothetical protein